MLKRGHTPVKIFGLVFVLEEFVDHVSELSICLVHFVLDATDRRSMRMQYPLDLIDIISDTFSVGLQTTDVAPKAVSFGTRITDFHTHLVYATREFAYNVGKLIYFFFELIGHMTQQNYRSISPRTISKLPIIATTSAIISPSAMTGNADRFTNDGPRKWTRSGFGPPFDFI